MGYKILISALVLLTFSSGARGQFLWEVVHTDADWRFEYRFNALSCSGDNCTAAGLSIDNLRMTNDLMFWRSTDGGTSWRQQDPKFPDGTGGYNNYFTRIQQIDSLNVVAIGKHGLIFRTFDGGKTWAQQDCHTTSNLSEIHFSDPMVGILTSSSIDSGGILFTTIDGGTHWKKVSSIPSSNYGFSQCHSFGNGKFSILALGQGPIYTTSDNWKTIDSSSILVDPAVDNHWDFYYFNGCQFGGKDTIIAYGWYSFQITGGAIVRSVDGGITWETPFIVNNTYGISHMTSIDRDTIIAGGNGISFVRMSIDRGKTWRSDTLILDTPYTATACVGIDWTTSHPIAAYGGGDLNFPGILLRGKIIKSSIHSDFKKVPLTAIYPNPAFEQVNIQVSNDTKIVYIVDILGREVTSADNLTNGRITLDIRRFPKGIYSVVGDLRGRRRYVGKLVIISAQ